MALPGYPSYYLFITEWDSFFCGPCSKYCDPRDPNNAHCLSATHLTAVERAESQWWKTYKIPAGVCKSYFHGLCPDTNAWREADGGFIDRQSYGTPAAAGPAPGPAAAKPAAKPAAACPPRGPPPGLPSAAAGPASSSAGIGGTVGDTTSAAGPQGERGPQGEPGERGEPGECGEPVHMRIFQCNSCAEIFPVEPEVVSSLSIPWDCDICGIGEVRSANK